MSNGLRKGQDLIEQPNVFNIAQAGERFPGPIFHAPRSIFVVGFDHGRSGETDNGFVTWEHADNVGSALEFLFESLQRSHQISPSPLGPWCRSQKLFSCSPSENLPRDSSTKFAMAVKINRM